MGLSTAAGLLTAAASLFAPFPTGCDDPGPVRVTVCTVLATADDTGVNPKLADLAKQVRKRNPGLMGFRLADTASKSIPVGETAAFPLVDGQELKVKVERPKDADGRISLTIRPPEVGDVTYACTCDKFFPVVTPYKTAKGEVLIVAVMAKPCAGGKKD